MSSLSFIFEDEEYYEINYSLVVDIHSFIFAKSCGVESIFENGDIFENFIKKKKEMENKSVEEVLKWRKDVSLSLQLSKKFINFYECFEKNSDQDIIKLVDEIYNFLKKFKF